MPEFHAELPVLGIPVAFRSNRQRVIELVDASFGQWNELPSRLRRGSAPKPLVEISVSAGQDGSHRRFRQRVRDDVFIARRGPNRLRANRTAGRAEAFVTEQLLADETAFCWFVVEALALFLLTWNHRIPFHASAVARNGTAVAFLGNSGSGKSTLAYACLRRGFELLSEDTVFVGTEPDWRIWGNSRRIHLRPDAAALFPELVGLAPCRHPNGKLKIPIALAGLPRGRPALQVRSALVCVLEPDHRNRASMAVPLSPLEVQARVLSTLEPGFALYRESLPPALDRMLDAGAYRLVVGCDLDAAAELVQRLVEEGEHERSALSR